MELEDAGLIAISSVPLAGPPIVSQKIYTVVSFPYKLVVPKVSRLQEVGRNIPAAVDVSSAPPDNVDMLNFLHRLLRTVWPRFSYESVLWPLI